MVLPSRVKVSEDLADPKFNKNKPLRSGFLKSQHTLTKNERTYKDTLIYSVDIVILYLTLQVRYRITVFRYMII